MFKITVDNHCGGETFQQYQLLLFRSYEITSRWRITFESSNTRNFVHGVSVCVGNEIEHTLWNKTLSDKNFQGTKFFVVQNFRHFVKFSSLLPYNVLSDKLNLICLKRCLYNLKQQSNAANPAGTQRLINVEKTSFRRLLDVVWPQGSLKYCQIRSRIFSYMHCFIRQYTVNLRDIHHCIQQYFINFVGTYY